MKPSLSIGQLVILFGALTLALHAAPADAPKLSLSPAERLLLQGKAMHKAGEHVEALKLLQPLAAKNPEALFLAAQCMAAKHQPKEALELLVQLSKGSGTWAELALFQAANLTAGQMGDLAGGMVLWQEVLKRFPQSGVADDALFSIACVHHLQGKTAMAKAELALLRKNYPKSSRVAILDDAMDFDWIEPKGKKKDSIYLKPDGRCHVVDLKTPSGIKLTRWVVNDIEQGSWIKWPEQPNRLVWISPPLRQEKGESVERPGKGQAANSEKTGAADRASAVVPSKGKEEREAPLFSQVMFER